jgi:hypothetical protein
MLRRRDLIVIVGAVAVGGCGEPTTVSSLRELGVIEGVVDVDRGTVDFRFEPAPLHMTQALTAIPEDGNGVAGTATVSQTVEFFVECNGTACASPFQTPATVTSGCGDVNSFEFDVTMRSFFPEGLKSAHVRFDFIQPLDNGADFSLCNEDPVGANLDLDGVPLSRGAGLVRYSGLAADANGGTAGGPVEAADTVRWKFRAPGGRFRFRAVPIAEVCAPGTCQPAVVQSRFWQVEGGRSTSGVLAIEEVAGAVVIGGEFSYVGPRTGSGARLSDHTVGTTASTLDFPAIEGGQVRAIIDDGAGGVFLGGSFTSVGGIARGGLAHVGADGTVGALTGNVSGTVSALAVTPTHLLVGGAFSAIGGLTRSNLGAVSLTTGVVDASWGGGANGTVRAIAIDGASVYIGGEHTEVSGVASARLTRLVAADGSVDVAFAGSVGVDDGAVNALLVAPGAPSGGSRVFLGGSFTVLRASGAPLTRTRMAAIDAGNLTALAFAPAPDASVNAMDFAVANSTIVIGGAFTRVGSSTRQRAARVDATSGALITAFNPGIGGGSVESLVVAADDSTVYIAGTFTQVDGQAAIARIGAINVSNGKLSTWRVVLGPNNGATTSGNALFSRAGEVFVGGTFGSVGGVRRASIAQLDLASGEANSWDPGLGGGTPSVRALVRTDDGVAVGGLFTVGASTNFVLLDEASAAPLSGASTNGSVNAIAAFGGVTYLGGAFTLVDGQSRSRLAAVDAFGLRGGWLGAVNDTVNGLAIVNDQLYVGGRFTTANGGAGSRLVSFGLDGEANAGSVTTNWAANATVNSVVACRDAAVAVGFFTSVRSTPRSGFVTLGRTTLGSRLFSAVGALTSVDCAGNAVSVAGAAVTGGTRAGQVNLFSGAQAIVNQQFNSSAAVVTAQVADLQFVGGSFANFGAVPRTGLVVFRAD